MRRSSVLGAATVAALAAGSLAVTGVFGSSHREAPDILADPTADNTDVYAFTAPDAPDKADDRVQLDPDGGAGRRPLLRQAGPEGPLLRQDRQHRRRLRGRRLPVAVPAVLPQPELVPRRGADGRLGRRSGHQLRPALRPLQGDVPEPQARRDAQDRARRARRAGQHRPEDGAELRQGRRRRRRPAPRAAASRSSGRSTIRSSSTSTPSSTASTSTSRAGRTSAWATRAAARTTSRATTRTASCCRCRSRR